jgi:hypothetical protein
VFDAFFKKSSLNQEDLQEFQDHILDLIPSQLQRFDLADSFSSLDDMMAVMERQKDPSYPTLLQIFYYMWPLLNTTNNGMIMANPKSWQKRELLQIGKFLFLMKKSTLISIPPELFLFDSTGLQSIQSNHLSQFQIWYEFVCCYLMISILLINCLNCFVRHLTSEILKNIDDHMKPDYIFLMPTPFQKGIPTENISQVLLTSAHVRTEVIKVLISQSEGMLVSQKVKKN